jgi:hypothetical protein
MRKKALEKVIITPEIRERQTRLRVFLRSHKEIEWKELRPHGFSIDTSTIPKDNIEEFLEIANSVKY